jgi:hypothetical protein
MMGLKLFLDLVVFIILGIYCYKFIVVLMKMKQKVILPISNEEIAEIRNYPQKPVDFPVYSRQKLGIILYSITLFFVFVMFLAVAILDKFDWSIYLLLFLPLTNTNNILNLFAIHEDGILSGCRFIPWKKIKTFHFVDIGLDHKYYGYENEVNGGHELKIKTTGFPVSCIVTSDEMKEKLNKLLSERIGA